MVLKRTKIVATLSPKCNSVETIRKFYQAGMNVARLNTAHLALDEAVVMIKNIREVSPEIGIMIDTKGPNIRVAELLEPLDVTAEQEILVSGENVPPGQGFKVSYNRFVDEVNPGMKIVIDDGEVELTVIAKRGNALVCRAVRDGRINNRKSVNVPNAELHTPALTAKDREYIDFAIKNDVDFIAHSFVRDRDDVMAVQSILDTAETFALCDRLGLFSNVFYADEPKHFQELRQLGANGILTNQAADLVQYLKNNKKLS